MPRVMKMERDENDDSNNITKTNMEVGKGKEGVRNNAWQMWHRNGTRCPKGTVPMRRSTVHDVLRAKSLYDYGKKRTQIPLSRTSDAPDVFSGNGHEVCMWFPTMILPLLHGYIL